MSATIARHQLAVADSELMAANLLANMMGRLSRVPRVAMGDIIGEIQEAVETRALNVLLRGYLTIAQVLVDQAVLTPSGFTDEQLDNRIHGLRKVLRSARALADIVAEDLADRDAIFERRLAERARGVVAHLIERTGVDLDLLVDVREERHERFTHRASLAQPDAFLSELEPLMDDPWVTHAIAAEKQFRGDADAEAASLHGRTQLPWHH